MQRNWIALSLLAVALTATTQQPTPTSRAEVTLEAHNGKTHFSLGDVVRLDLVFRDSAFPDVRSTLPHNKIWVPIAGQKAVNDTDYGDIADDVSISPSTGWFRWQGKSGHDYLSQTPLDATGVRVKLILNQGYVFRDPGHYEIAVTTHRMGNEPVTTNAIGIDIAARSPEDEAALVKTLDATIAGSTGKERKRAVEQLSYLPGDDAARAKVKWLLADDQDTASAMTDGLAATKNQSLQLELLRAAWADPNHAPDGTLQRALQRAEAFAQGQMEPGFVMFGTAQKESATTRALAAQYREDLNRVIATLPQRKGDVRRDTTYYLMEDNRLSPEQLAAVKPIALEEFPRMEPIAQSMLIETRWDAIKDPSLAPWLKAIIERKDQEADAATAVQRLIEIDEPESKPYVIQMICRAKGAPLLDKLSGVKQDRLPEVDECLTALLAKGERNPHNFEWEQAAERAARFATPSVLPQIKAVWNEPSQDSTMLALLMRDAPKEAVELLAREPDINWYPANQVYGILGKKFPPEVLAWLRHSIPSRSASYELAQFGETQDRTLLEQSLLQLRKQWLGHETELKEARDNSPAFVAKGEEMEIVSSLLSARAWSLTEEEKVKVTDGCLSDWCQRYAPHKSVPSNN